MRWLALFFRWLAAFMGVGFFILASVLFRMFGLGCFAFVVLAFSAALLTWAVLPLFRERL